MSSQRVQIIGGPCHGRRVTVDTDRETWNLDDPRAPGARLFPYVRFSTYVRVRIEPGDWRCNAFYIYRHTSLTDAEAVSMYLRGKET